MCIRDKRGWLAVGQERSNSEIGTASRLSIDARPDTETGVLMVEMVEGEKAPARTLHAQLRMCTMHVREERDGGGEWEVVGGGGGLVSRTRRGRKKMWEEGRQTQLLYMLPECTKFQMAGTC
jgi:hypothetical protein